MDHLNHPLYLKRLSALCTIEYRSTHAPALMPTAPNEWFFMWSNYRAAESRMTVAGR